VQSVIATFAGGIASGKTTISHRVAAKLGWSWGSFSEFVQKKAGSKDRLVLQNLGESLVLFDPTAFTQEFLNSLEWKPGTNLVLDGLRHKTVLDALRDIAYPTRVLLIYLEAPFSVRQRRVSRGVEVVELAKLESHPVEEEALSILSSLADLVVESSGDEATVSERVLMWLRDGAGSVAFEGGRNR